MVSKSIKSYLGASFFNGEWGEGGGGAGREEGTMEKCN